MHQLSFLYLSICELDADTWITLNKGENVEECVLTVFLLCCRLAAHFGDIDFDVSLVTTEWFLCLFAKSLPAEVSPILFLLHCISLFLSLVLQLYDIGRRLWRVNKDYSLRVHYSPHNQQIYRFLYQLWVLNCSWCKLMQTTMRVWDVLFNEGANILFRVALAVFKVQGVAPYPLGVAGMNWLRYKKETCHSCGRLS